MCHQQSFDVSIQFDWIGRLVTQLELAATAHIEEFNQISIALILPIENFSAIIEIHTLVLLRTAFTSNRVGSLNPHNPQIRSLMLPARTTEQPGFNPDRSVYDEISTKVGSGGYGRIQS